MSLDPRGLRPPFSLPEYPFKHSGTVLVCGNAYSLFSDYERARQLYPDAPAIAVKGASEFIQAFAVFGMHPRKMARCVALQSRLHGDFTSHIGGNLKDKSKLGHRQDYEPDYRWPLASGGSSGWAARKMAYFMGFDTVILCGVPMDRGGYAGNVPSIPFQQQRIIDIYRNQILEDVGFHKGVYSMSGWTMELFGCP